jgi:hypothetical protein
MRMLRMIAIAAFAVSGAAQAADANPPACAPNTQNFYTVEVAITAPNEAAFNVYRNIIDPVVGGKCFSQMSSPTQGRTFCMYPLVSGAPPKVPELGEIFNAIAVLTPREGNKDGTVAITSIKTKITCKPSDDGGCVLMACTGGTMLVPNCRACS